MGRLGRLSRLRDLYALPCVLLAVFALAPIACGTDYYVNATTGDDANSGLSSATPWKTLQWAADVMGAGSTCHVAPGVYPQRIRIRRSGEPGMPIRFNGEGAGVIVGGFTVGNHRGVEYVIIQGFEITLARQASLDTDEAGTGVALVDTQYCEVRNCYIHHTLREGVRVRTDTADDSFDSSHNVVAYNRIEYAGGYAGITVNGAYQSILNNNISHTVQNPLYPVMSTANGADADGIKFSGRDLLIRGNYFHDLNPNETGNVNPHIDALQTFGPAYNILIERNHINLPTDQGETQAAMIEQSVAPVRDIVLRYNIVTAFRGFNIWGYNTRTNAVVPLYRVTVANNTFYGVRDYDFELHDCPDAVVKNNVISVSGRYMWANLPVATSNNAVPGSLPLRAGDIRISDPMFVDPANRDFHLKPDSPLIDAGANLGYTGDLENGRVPQGTAPDIGAFESPNSADLDAFLIPLLTGSFLIF